jgi:hypothetical protein
MAFLPIGFRPRVADVQGLDSLWGQFPPDTPEGL